MEDTLNKPLTSKATNNLNHHHHSSDSFGGPAATARNARAAEEDFKRSIPYFSKPQIHRSNDDEINQYETLESDPELQDIKTFDYQVWPTEDEYGEDDIGHRLGFDYATAASHTNDESKFAAASYLQDINCPAAAAAASTMDSMSFRPPIASASNLQYNYNYPQSTGGGAVAAAAAPSPAYSHRQRPTIMGHYATTSTITQPAGSTGVAGSQAHCGGGDFGGQSGYHPNMWFPNAPYGSGGFYPSYGHGRLANYGGSGYTHDQLVEMHQLSNSGREARNRAEKNRRDKMNGYIQVLSTLVPHVADSPRRVDKTTVLRSAVHGLRLNYVFRDSLTQSRPQLTDSVMKLLDCFFITLTCHGHIVLISSSVEHHLGHCQVDLYGQNILHITHPEDHELMRQQLIPTDLETLFDIQPDDNPEEPRERTQDEEDYIDQKLRSDKRCFTVRLSRAGPRSEPTSYEVVKIDGCFRRSDTAPRGFKTSSSPSGCVQLRRTQRRDEAIPLHTISGNDIVLVAIARIIRPPKIAHKIMEANGLEYKTRHLIDGRIIDCDQRIGIVAGYMTDEVRNLSPFTFMHQDDVRWVIVALRQMYDCNSSYGESTYRLLTRNGYFIYLQSKGYLEIDKEKNTVHSFVCVNTLLDEEEGKRRVEEMKKKFSIIINTKIPETSSSMDVPASENPQQLVKAVLCLIQNLQKNSSDDEEVDGTLSQYDNSAQCSATDKSFPSRSSNSFNMRSIKTPPLALVPPEPSTVKTSITKSVSVVNITAAKHLRGNMSQSPRYSKSPPSVIDDLDNALSPDQTAVETFNCLCPYQDDGALCEDCEKSRNRVSRLKRSTSCSENEELKLPKRRLKSTEIQHVIISSLDQLGRSLQQQQNAAIELRDQSDKYEVPNSKNKIKAIMEECQKQNEMFVNITSEIQSQGIDSVSSVEKDTQLTDFNSI